jgi:hypothetical protein
MSSSSSLYGAALFRGGLLDLGARHASSVGRVVRGHGPLLTRCCLCGWSLPLCARVQQSVVAIVPVSPGGDGHGYGGGEGEVELGELEPGMEGPAAMS